jgi:hypothetical protein
MFFSLICSIIHICQPPATCFNPQPRFPPQTTCFNPQPHILTIWPRLSTPSHAFRPPSCPFQHPQAQTTPDTLLGPRCIFFSFLYVYFSFICPIIAVCQPPATCFDPQPRFLTIRPRLSTPSHMFSTPINLFRHPRSRNMRTSNCTHVSYIFFFWL